MTLSDDWRDWKLKAEQKQAEEQKAMLDALSQEKHPITEKERSAILALRGCTFIPASWDKKFVRSLQGKEQISERQQYWLKKLVVKYRRQLKLTDEQADLYFVG